MIDKRDKATRVVVMVHLDRGLYLHRSATAHEYIALHSTPEEVVDKAAGIISAMHPAGESMNHFGISWDVVAASGCFDMTWPMLYLQFVLADDEHAGDIMKLHMLMSTRMGAHVRGVFANLNRAQWLMTGLISSDASKAQRSAK